jgi:NADPH-dependent 2,4-dienoyl-CoA reductase/sulfur reductase-like enzyme
MLIREGYPGVPLLDQDAGTFISGRAFHNGIHCLYNEEVSRYEKRDSGLTVITKSGMSIKSDIVIECIGIAPDLEWLGDLHCENERIIVSESLETSQPDVYAAGDVAEVRFADGHTVRGYTWITAISQARAAAENMAGTEAAWREGVAINADFFFDMEFIMIGPWDRRSLPGRKSESRVREDSFAAVVTNKGVIESALLIGDRSADKLIRKLISQQANIAGKFAKLFEAGATVEDFG